jgi:hypothetical protein
MKKQNKKTKDLVELKTITTKNIYGVIYKGKSYVVNCYFSDDNCGDFEWEVYNNNEEELKDENLIDEITSFIERSESNIK